MTSTAENIRNYFSKKIGNSELGIEKQDLTTCLNAIASNNQLKAKLYAFDNQGTLRIITIPYYEDFYEHLAQTPDFFDIFFNEVIMLPNFEMSIAKTLFCILCPAGLAGFDYDENIPNNKFSPKIANIRFDAQEKFDRFRHKTFERFEPSYRHSSLPDFKLFKHVRFINSVIDDDDFDSYFPRKPIVIPT